MTRKSILIIAFHFPPFQGSSGLYRTLSWARHLSNHDWDVTVLTASSLAYRNVRDENLSLIPKNVKVIRALALDTKRHLAFRGRYLGLLTIPDQYQSWIASGCIAGWLHCLRRRPDLVVSTYPISSAHYIASFLNRVTKIPWVADFRDPMVQEDYPPDPRQRRVLQRLEKSCMRIASRIFVTTPGTRRRYAETYAEIVSDKLCVVPNGYDQNMFDGVDSTARTRQGADIILLHSGALYKRERDPACLFEALGKLKKRNLPELDRLRVVFRGTGDISYFEELAERHSVGALVEFRDPVSYQEAISEMLGADGLLILQSSGCNDQIPAKVYEYVRTRRPIVALTDPSGDTAQVLASCSINSVANLDDAGSIEKLLEQFLCGDVRQFSAPDNFDVEQFSRQRIAVQAADVFSSVCD